MVVWLRKGIQLEADLTIVGPNLPALESANNHLAATERRC
jgi:hypothetical protein